MGYEHFIPIAGDPHAVAIATGVNTRQGSRNIVEFAFEYVNRRPNRRSRRPARLFLPPCVLDRPGRRGPIWLAQADHARSRGGPGEWAENPLGDVYAADHTGFEFKDRPELTVLRKAYRQTNRQASPIVRRVDIGMCNERPFLLWAGVGLDAFIVHRLEPRSRMEKYLAIPSYAMKAAWSASLWHGMNLSAEVDGKSIHGHYLLGVVFSSMASE